MFDHSRSTKILKKQALSLPFVCQCYLRKRPDPNFYTLGHWLDRLLEVKVVHAFVRKTMALAIAVLLMAETGKSYQRSTSYESTLCPVKRRIKLSVSLI
jgi:hypothetical protein